MPGFGWPANVWGQLSLSKPRLGPVTHEPRQPLAAADPCGGSWWRDCQCGWVCPTQSSEEAADAALADHIASENEAA